MSWKPCCYWADLSFKTARSIEKHLTCHVSPVEHVCKRQDARLSMKQNERSAPLSLTITKIQIAQGCLRDYMRCSKHAESASVNWINICQNIAPENLYEIVPDERQRAHYERTAMCFMVNSRPRGGEILRGILTRFPGF